MDRKTLLQFALLAAYLAVVTFVPAGTLLYPAGWILLVEIVVGGLWITDWLREHDPELLEKRMSSPLQQGQERWDRIFLVCLIIGFTLWLAFCAWDAARLAFVEVPVLVQFIGAGGIVFYMWGAWRTFRENSFAAPAVKVQEGQKTIETGPYAIVRHPMYASSLGMFIGAPLLLGSYWGLVGSAILIAGVAWRATNEERVLKAGLSGYGDYMSRVRFRLIPRVW